MQSVDSDTRTIMLEDGQAFVAGDTVDLASIQAGSNVTVMFDDGTNTATRVRVN